MNKRPGIYILQNLVNGKYYIGKDSYLPTRVRQHFSNISDGCKLISYAIKKYGQDAFSVTLIDYPGFTSKQLSSIEIRYIAEYNSCILNPNNNGYNMTYGGEGASGYIHTNETKRKISESKKGIPRTPDVKQKVSESRKGQKLSNEHKRRVSQSLKGRKHTDETKQKMSKNNGMKGKRHTAEARKKMSENSPRKRNPGTFTGKQHTTESKRKMSEAHKGKRLTDETRRKISENNGMKGKQHTAETRRKMSETLRRRRNLDAK